MQISEPCYTMHTAYVKRDNSSTETALKMTINAFSRYTNALENTIKQTGAYAVCFSL